MVSVYKLGRSYLKSYTNDRNSANFELDLIKKQVEGLERDILIIVGGIADQYDLSYLESIFKNRKYEKIVFLATDTYSLKYKDIIEKCDLFMHQALVNLKNYNVRQDYSFVPELFYSEREDVPKSNILLFAGNNLNRKEELNKFLYDAEGNPHRGILSFVKDYSTMKDSRIGHKEYIDLLDHCKYNLVISSEWIYDNNWITARMIEAFSSRSIPLVSSKYDMLNWYDHKETRVTGYADIISVMNGHREYRIEKELNNNIMLARERSKEFRKIIQNL